MMSNTKLYTIFESKNDTSKVETRIMYIRVDYKRKFLLNIETQKIQPHNSFIKINIYNFISRLQAQTKKNLKTNFQI